MDLGSLQNSHQGRISCLGLSADGSALCTGSYDTNLKVSLEHHPILFHLMPSDTYYRISSLDVRLLEKNAEFFLVLVVGDSMKSVNTHVKTDRCLLTIQLAEFI